MSKKPQRPEVTELLDYSDFRVRAVVPSKVLLGRQVFVESSVSCPSCLASNTPLIEESQEVVCPCGLWMRRVGYCLEIGSTVKE